MVTRMALGVPVALAIARFRFPRLRRAAPRVLGLASPAGYEPVMLRAEGWEGGRLTEVALSYGRLLDVTAPLVEVTTHLDGGGDLPSREVDILQRERQDAAITRHDWEAIENEAGGVDDEDAAARLAISDQYLDVLVDGEPRTVSVLSYRHFRALRLSYDNATVRVVSRHGTPELPRFELVTDLEPYFRGYARFVRSWLTFSPRA
jgi:hypothetical protein